MGVVHFGRLFFIDLLMSKISLVKLVMVFVVKVFRELDIVSIRKLVDSIFDFKDASILFNWLVSVVILLFREAISLFNWIISGP